MSFRLSIFIVIMAVSLSIYFILLENADISATEKFTPYATNMLRYHWSLYSFDHGTNDSLSAMFIPPICRYIIASPILRWFVLLFLKQHKQSKLFSAVALRTEFFDQTWIKGIQQANIKQIVSFGAGFDTRALRFDQIIKENNVTIFELDLPKLISRKHKLISNYLGSDQLPPYLSLVECNFDQFVFNECLKKHNFDPNVATILHMEGIIMYLEPNMVHKTFTFIKENLCKGSIVAVDILVDFDEINELKQELKKRNEPLKFVMKHSEIDMFMRRYDLNIFKMEGILDGLIKYLPKDIHDRFGLPDTNHMYHILAKLEEK